ncbi:MAG TPA: hypothetical protein VF669_02670 [Tepidisphaeraceae bacterium]|jgi:hypothetical protein
MEMSDVILIFRAGQAQKLDDEALAEVFAATNVERPGDGVVSCTIPSSKVHDISRDPRVAYVRRVQAYIGSFDA